MYIPEFNRIEDSALTLAFLRANPFATMISATETGPFATHLPILAREADGQLHLRGHVAKANPHWKSLGQDQDSLVIFNGWKGNCLHRRSTTQTSTAGDHHPLRFRLR